MQPPRNNIDQIISQIDRLSYDEKVEVMDKIIHSFKRQRLASRPGLTSLKGLGKNIWQDIDVDQYINSQRKAWD